MIKRSPLGRRQMGNLRVYAGAEHPHAAQTPVVLDLAAKNAKNKRERLIMATINSLADLKAGAAAAVTAAPAAPAEPKLDAFGRAYATGKRKNAVARVWLKPGSGKITVNGRELVVYFARPVLRMMINQPYPDRRPH